MNIFKNASSTRPTVALLPGEIFFVQRIELPEGMSDADVFSFVQITLEESSPFPIEQLAWGFLQAPNSRGILLYSTTLERLKRYQPENLSELYHVFPSFISPCMQTWEEPTAFCLLQGNTLSALYFKANDPIPTHVINQAIPANTDRSVFELAFELRDSLLNNFKHLNPIYEAGILLGTESTVDTTGDIEFHHKHYLDLSPEAGQTVEPTTLERSKTRWNADIRENAFKNTENKKRLTNRRLQFGLYAAGIFLVCILLAHVIRFGAKYYDYRLNTKLTSQASHVRKIEEDAALLDRLNQLAEKRFMPFTMLGILNITRPADIYFENIKVDPSSGLEVHGISSSVSEVNTYVSSLEHIEVIDDIKLSDIQTRRGKVNFTLLTDFDFTSIPDTELEALNLPAENKSQNTAKTSISEKNSSPESTSPIPSEETKIETNNINTQQNQPSAPQQTSTPLDDKNQPPVTTINTPTLSTTPPSSIPPSNTNTDAQTKIPHNPPIAQPNVQKSTNTRTPTQPVQTRARTFSAPDISEPSLPNTPIIIPEDELSE